MKPSEDRCMENDNESLFFRKYDERAYDDMMINFVMYVHRRKKTKQVLAEAVFYVSKIYSGDIAVHTMRKWRFFSSVRKEILAVAVTRNEYYSGQKNRPSVHDDVSIFINEKVI